MKSKYPSFILANGVTCSYCIFFDDNRNQWKYIKFRGIYCAVTWKISIGFYLVNIIKQSLK